VTLVMEIIVWIRYARANRKPISTQMTGIEAARYVLDKEGLYDVNVRQAGILREAIFGNYYNIMTKTIYLRSIFGKIDLRKSVTSTALAVQKAALAKLCESGDRSARTRNTLSLIGIFGPFLFIPVILIGVVVDFMVLHTGGLVSTVCLAISGLFVVTGFIVTMLNIPVEKRANEEALRLMEKHGMATSEELQTIAKVYDAYIISYICDFILEILRMVQWILEIVIKAKSKNND
ncbi:MAG: zinc metallopeptidase, partial [Erysipelotrichaceae bacterium]|nr:zinc metallopeptidase [Erysipelotrichaceae bacterium]